MDTPKKMNDKLTPEQEHVLFEKGTEPPFTGLYVDNHDTGMYRCANCNTSLFSSGDKFDSGSGWPSFTQAVTSDNVILSEDNSHGMHRVEVTCKTCGAHLGHLFDDGPEDCGGKRYCINSAALDFLKKAP